MTAFTSELAPETEKLLQGHAPDRLEPNLTYCCFGNL